jgi:hypothetical protein
MSGWLGSVAWSRATPAPQKSAALTIHQALGGRLVAVIGLLLQVSARPKEKLLARGRVGDEAEPCVAGQRQVLALRMWAEIVWSDSADCAG